MSWFGNKITDRHIKELKLIKYLMEKSNDKFVFKNPPDKKMAQAWDIEDWQMWLDDIYKESVR